MNNVTEITSSVGALIAPNFPSSPEKHLTLVHSGMAIALDWRRPPAPATATRGRHQLDRTTSPCPRCLPFSSTPWRQKQRNLSSVMGRLGVSSSGAWEREFPPGGFPL